MELHSLDSNGPITTTVIIPALNEQNGIEAVLEKLCPVLDHTYQLIVVDDGSSDKTGEVARSFPCQVIRHEFNRGKGEALKTGFR